MQLLQWRGIWQQSNQQRHEQRPSSPTTATDDHQVANILINLAASHYVRLYVSQSQGSQEMSLQTIKEVADTETLKDADAMAGRVDTELLFSMEL